MRSRAAARTGNGQQNAEIVRCLVEQVLGSGQFELLPSLIADSETLKSLIADGIVHLVPKGSRFLWESRVWRLSGGSATGETT